MAPPFLNTGETYSRHVPNVVLQVGGGVVDVVVSFPVLQHYPHLVLAAFAGGRAGRWAEAGGARGARNILGASEGLAVEQAVEQGYSQLPPHYLP